MTGWQTRLTQLRQSVGEFLYGMTGFDFVHQAQQMRHETETLFMLLVFGDVLGLPVLPPYFSLRLLPYTVPELEGWKRRVVRERHPLDKEEYDLVEL